MIFITDFENKLNFDKYNVDGFIVNSKEFSTYNGNTFSINDIIDILKSVKENNKFAFLNLDKLIEEDELDSLREYINKVSGYYDYIIFSDFAFMNLGIDRSKMIYDPKTLVSSSNEANFFNNIGIKSFLANELSIDEYQKISEKCEVNMTVFGHILMMYSRRPLFRLYKEFSGINDDVLFKRLDLKEELREELYPGFESNHGSFIYTDYIYNSYNKYLLLKNKMNIVRFNHLFIESEEMIEVISGFKEENLNSKYLDYKKYKEGFLNKGSILLKEAKDE